MELNVLTLQCQTANGARAYERNYGDFLNKFKNDLATNGRSLQQMVVANATTSTCWSPNGQPHGSARSVDKEFCARGKRAFDWALSAESHLEQVPAPYDIGPEMNVYPCRRPEGSARLEGPLGRACSSLLCSRRRIAPLR